MASGAVFMFCAPALVFGGAEGVGSRFQVLRSRTRFRLIRGRRDPFSCFALPNSFSAVTRASVPIFMFCALGHVFNGAECVGSRFHVLPSRTRFRRCGGRRVPFSCFMLPNSFSAVSGMSGPVFKFCAPGLVFGGAEGVGSRFDVFHRRTRFRRCGGRRVPFSYFALPDLFTAVRSASGPVFMFSAPELVFGGIGDVGSCFQVLRSLTRFRQF
jgi:hypothetical protein